MAKDPCEALELQLRQAEKEAAKLEKRASDLKKALGAKGRLSDLPEGDPGREALRVLTAEQDPLSMGTDTVPALSGRRAITVTYSQNQAKLRLPTWEVISADKLSGRVTASSVTVGEVIQAVEKAEAMGVEVDPGALAVRDFVESNPPGGAWAYSLDERLTFEGSVVPVFSEDGSSAVGMLSIDRVSTIPKPLRGKGYGMGIYMSVMQRAKNLDMGLQSGHLKSVTEHAQAVWDTLREILGKDVVVKYEGPFRTGQPMYLSLIHI